MLSLLMSTPFGISAPLLTHTVRAEKTRQAEEANGSFKSRFKELWRCCKSHSRNRRKCVGAVFVFSICAWIIQGGEWESQCAHEMKVRRWRFP